jgi:hypothetical protein
LVIVFVLIWLQVVSLPKGGGVATRAIIYSRLPIIGKTSSTIVEVLRINWPVLTIASKDVSIAVIKTETSLASKSVVAIIAAVKSDYRPSNRRAQSPLHDSGQQQQTRTTRTDLTPIRCQPWARV